MAAPRPAGVAPAAPAPTRPAPDTRALEQGLARVEQHLALLAELLPRPDAAAIEHAAIDLRAALGDAMTAFAGVARQGTVPAALRQRFAIAGAQVAAQREALTRASAALDQAMDILIPQAPAPAVYSAWGTKPRSGTGRVIAAS